MAARMPPVVQRLRQAAAVLRGTQYKENPVGGAIVAATNSSGRPLWTQRDLGTIAELGFNRNGVLYRSVMYIAQSGKGVQWNLYQGKKASKRVRLDDHPLIDLWERPNPERARGSFVEQSLAWWVLEGNSYMTCVGPKSRRGPPLELWNLRPDRMRVIPDAKQHIGGYLYTVNAQNERLDADKVLHLRMFAAADDWYGLSPVLVAARDVDAMNAGADWNAALMDNFAKPAGALIAKGVLSKTQRDDLREELREKWQGPQNARRPVVLDGDMTWQAFSMTPEQLDWLESRGALRDAIAVTIGVPPEMVGGDKKTYANYAEARLSFWEETMLPLLDAYEDELNLWLVPQFGDDLFLGYDKDSISALREKRQGQTDQAIKLWQSGLADGNEARKVIGMEPVPELEGVRLVPAGYQLLRTLINPPATPDAGGAPALPPGGGPGRLPGGDDPAAIEGGQPGDGQRALPPGKQEAGAGSTPAQIIPDQSTGDAVQAKLLNWLNLYLKHATQEPMQTIAEAIEHLGSAGSLMHTRPTQPVTDTEKLAAICQEAKAQGEKAPVYELCQVAMRGANLFCSDSLDIPREELPQLKGIPTPGSPADSMPKNEKGAVDLGPAFKNYLASQGHRVDDTTEDASYLRASQREIDGSKVARMMQAMEERTLEPGSIFISQENYVVDGHHRWAATIGTAYQPDQRVTMPVSRVDLPILETMQKALDFASAMGIPQAGIKGQAKGALAPEEFALACLSLLLTKHLAGEHGQRTHDPTGVAHTDLGPHVSERAKGQVDVSDWHMHNFSAEAQTACVTALQSRYGVTWKDSLVQATWLMEQAKANPQVWNEGKQWYAKAGEQSRAIGRRWQIDERQAIGVVAALSPKLAWDDEVSDPENPGQKKLVTPNLTNAEMIMRAVHENKTVAVTQEMADLLRDQKTSQSPLDGVIGHTKPLDAYTLEEQAAIISVTNTRVVNGQTKFDMQAMGDNVVKGLQIARGTDPGQVLSGAKVRSFFNNLYAPEVSRDVTVDTWMVRALSADGKKMRFVYNAGKADHDKGIFSGADVLIATKAKGLTNGTYPFFADVISHMARRYGLKAHEAQAIMWTIARKLGMSLKADGLSEGDLKKYTELSDTQLQAMIERQTKAAEQWPEGMIATYAPDPDPEDWVDLESLASVSAPRTCETELSAGFNEILEAAAQNYAGVIFHDAPGPVVERREKQSIKEMLGWLAKHLEVPGDGGAHPVLLKHPNHTTGTTQEVHGDRGRGTLTQVPVFGSSKAAEVWAESHLPGPKWDFKGCHPSVARSLLVQADVMMKSYPEAAKRLVYVGMGQAHEKVPFDAVSRAHRDLPECFGSCFHEGGKSAIWFNPAIMGDPAKVEAMLKANARPWKAQDHDEAIPWTVPGGNTIEAKFTHEYAHVIQQHLEESEAAFLPVVGPKGLGRVGDTVKLWQERHLDKAEKLSGYAREAKRRGKKREAFAEGVVALHHTPKGKQPEYVSELSKLFKRLGNPKEWKKQHGFLSMLVGAPKAAAIALLKDVAHDLKLDLEALIK